MPCQQPKRPDFQPIPDSQLLVRLKGFLPGMADANKQLGAQMNQVGPAAFSIEHATSDSDSEAGPHIELDLTCGLVDLQDEAAVAAAERAAALGNRATTEASGSSSSASDSSGTSEDDASSPSSSTSSDASSGSEPDSLLQTTGSGCAASCIPRKLPCQQGFGGPSTALPSAKCRTHAAIQML